MPRQLSDSLSLAEARRIALAAQGFHLPRPKRVTARQVAGAIECVGVLQLDFVNVLTPAHNLILFSRLGPFDTTLLARVYASRRFIEQWAHEASIVPIEVWPLLAHRRQTHRSRPWGTDAFLEAHPEYLEEVMECVRAGGPVCAANAPEPPPDTTHVAGEWYRSVARVTLEALFGRGVLAVACRLKNFARGFDLAERVIPPELFSQALPRPEAERELLLRAARAHGVGTAADLADYYRLRGSGIKTRLAELVESRALRPVKVESWRQPAFLDPNAVLPARAEAHRLLSPFDPLVWFRPRAERLFGFAYRVEIYTPAHLRKWGYYVLPFLSGERIAARVDLKADRAGKRLVVAAAHLEDHADPSVVATALAGELQSVAQWLGLESVRVERRGGLARALAGVVNHMKAKM